MADRVRTSLDPCGAADGRLVYKLCWALNEPSGVAGLEVVGNARWSYEAIVEVRKRSEACRESLEVWWLNGWLNVRCEDWNDPSGSYVRGDGRESWT